MNRRIVIAGACRTSFGRFRGSWSTVSPVQLGTLATLGALKGIDPEAIDHLVVGNVLGAGHGMNLARQIAIQSGLKNSSTAYTVNMMCGSGLHAIALAVDAIRLGRYPAVLAGGVESMSQSRLLVNRPGRGQEPAIADLADSMQMDGLRDAIINEHMGETAERLAREFDISREQQDVWAERSQWLFQKAEKGEAFRSERLVTETCPRDEHPRPGITRDDLSGLSPVFSVTGTVTAGNSSGINDGAAMVLVSDAEHAVRCGWPILCEWIDAASIGCDPSRMGLGPVHAIRLLCSRLGRNPESVDTLEINEAFAAQTLACLKELGCVLGTESHAEFVRLNGSEIRLNACGGAIALGHPLAASGARLACHLAWEIHNGLSRSAIAALCIGGGMGIAALLQKYP